MRTGLIFAGFLLSGLTGALASRVLFPPDPPAPVPPASTADLEARIERLEAEQEALRSAPPPPAPAPSGPRGTASAGAPAPVDPVVTPATAPGDPAPVPEAVIEEKVREVIRERAEAAAAEKAKRDAIAQAEKDARFLGKLQEALDLTDYQREELGVHLKARREALAEYKRQLEEAGPDVSPGRRKTIEQELLDFVSVQDEDLRRLLGVETFDELMRITGGKDGARRR